MEVVRAIPILFLPNKPKWRFSSAIDTNALDEITKSFEALLASDCGTIFVFDNCSRVAPYINTFKHKEGVGKEIILAESREEVTYVNIVNWFLRRIGENFDIAGIMESSFVADNDMCSQIISRMEDADIAHGITTFFKVSKVPHLPTGGWEQFIEQHPELKVI